ncbi:hypothetical protein EVAR_67262_1 [Eumeta japonica]|uniref:Uncharacterized protein n=1 Tax=Eumeta variegata TaxID=151549 RepID=A0A4C1ZQX2_EUMVA|nr:hypothetical protein EVAR_67262_1 [Eumeta japonica]
MPRSRSVGQLRPDDRVCCRVSLANSRCARLLTFQGTLEPIQEERAERLIDEEVLKDPLNVKKLKYQENVLGKNVTTPTYVDISLPNFRFLRRTASSRLHPLAVHDPDLFSPSQFHVRRGLPDDTQTLGFRSGSESESCLVLLRMSSFWIRHHE